MKLLLCALLSVGCYSASAQAHKCTDASGKVTYGNTPCTANSTPSKVNLSGANITEQQAQDARRSKVEDSERTSSEAEPIAPDSRPKRHSWMKDQFGTTVRSDRCYWTKDALGTSVRSGNCN